MAPTVPNTFVLKSSHNNKYLAYVKDEGEVHGLLKSSADDVSELTVFEVEPAKGAESRHVHLRCSYINKYWRRRSADQNWIAAEADEPEEDQSKWSCTLFKPVFVDDDPNTVRFIHVQQGHYACLATTNDAFSSCLYAAGSNPNDNNLYTFALTELVPLLREITDVQFDLKNAKFCDLKTVELGYGIATNNLPDSNVVTTVRVDYNKDEFENSVCWKGKSSMNSEVVTRIKSAMPEVVNEKMELTGHAFTGPYQMGQTMVSTVTGGKTVYNMVIPPMTKEMVTLTASKASFQVPFSFKRQDTLSDKKVLTFKKNDGVYTGITHFDLKYENEEKPRSANVFDGYI